jgi:ubiquinone biosynthesis UbiH/UbiF/VisC/COQ6 family hydroxylase
MQISSDICVIGNGAVGKAAVLGLAQAGLRITHLAPSGAAPDTAASWDVRVYALNQVAHDLLDSLKVWNAMDAARIAVVDAMDVRGDGKHAGHLTFDAYGARTGALAWIVEERNLSAALDTALKFAPNLRTINGRAVGMRTTGERAEVRLDNGDVIDCALIIGADGAQSWVRGQCDINLDYRSYGQRAIVTNFDCEKPHRGVAYQWFTSTEGIVALLPLPGERTSLVWSAPEHLAESLLRGTAEQLAERVGAVSGNVLGKLKPVQPEVVRSFPLSLLRTHSMIAPRVALVGDAAHVVHPLAGHGMNLGFGDVLALLRVLGEREPQRDCGDERVLARYARARKEDVLLMQVATDGLERLFGADFEPLRMARNIGLNLVNSLPVLKRQLIAHALGRR